MSNTVFVSHSSKDSILASRILNDLRARDYETSSFEDVIDGDAEGEPGELDPRLEERISRANYFVPILTPSAVESRWIDREIAHAVEAEAAHESIRILPVLGEPCALPTKLGLRYPADFTRSYQDGLSSLLAMLAPSSASAALGVDLPADSQRSLLQKLVVRIRDKEAGVFELPPWKFETALTEILAEHGYEVRLARHSRDTGFDVIALSSWNFNREPFILQCKRHSPTRQLTFEQVDSLVASAIVWDPHVAQITTTSSCIQPTFFDSAKSEAFEIKRWRSRSCFNFDRDQWTHLFGWLASSRGFEELVEKRVDSASVPFG